MSEHVVVLMTAPAVDVAERVARAVVTDPTVPAPRLATWLGCPAREVPRVVRALIPEPAPSPPPSTDDR